MLAVSNLTVCFPLPGGVITPVRNFSLILKRGETLGLTGPSGCGKTVFCTSLIGMLEKPGYIKSGSITYAPGGAGSGELDLSTLSETQWRKIRGKEISMIFQNPFQSLNHSRTVGAQFVEAIAAHDTSSSRRERRELAESMLTEVLPDNPQKIMKSYPFELSGGMCQRVIIAMALVHKPSFLIADEPASALDKKNETQILRLFEKIRETCHTGILLISHDEQVIRAVANRKVSMVRAC